MKLESMSMNGIAKEAVDMIKKIAEQPKEE